jgi:hypothetical protein
LVFEGGKFNLYKIEPFVDKYDIYINKELNDFIIELENHYNLVDKVENFAALVNFSQNGLLPYHGWFKYREGYGSALVSHLIEEENLSQDEYVIDPFSGSGTTLVEAALQGYSSFGIDVNPMSSFVADTKVKRYTPQEIENIKDTMALIENSSNSKLQDNVSHDSSLDYRWDYLKRYFQERHLADFKAIVEYVESISETKIRNFFMAACLAVTEDISDRRRDGNGLKTAPSKVQSVSTRYKLQVEQMLRDIVEYPIPTSGEGKVIAYSAVDLSTHASEFSRTENKVPGVIIFSPPYANSFDYFESYKMELYLGGFVKSPSDMKELRKKAVHSFIRPSSEHPQVDWFIEEMAKEIEYSIPEKEKRTGKVDSRTRKVPALIRGYFYDMGVVLKSCAETLPIGKRTYIVVDQSAYLGKIVPTDLFLAKIAETHGFVVEKIIVCRKAKTSAQQYQLYPYLENTLRESIVVLRKEG